MTVTADFEKLGGLVSKVSVTVERKISDGNFGSNGASLVLEANVGKGADLDALCDALDAYGKAYVARSLGAAVEQVREQTVGVTFVAAGKASPPILGPLEVEIEPDEPRAKPEGEVSHVSIKKFDLLEKPDNKWELALYPDIKGKPGKWPEIKFTTVGRDDMWKMIDSVWDRSWKAPISKEVDWVAEYTLGREYEITRGENAGKTGRYKDLRGLHTA